MDYLRKPHPVICGIYAAFADASPYLRKPRTIICGIYAARLAPLRPYFFKLQASDLLILLDFLRGSGFLTTQLTRIFLGGSSTVSRISGQMHRSLQPPVP